MSSSTVSSGALGGADQPVPALGDDEGAVEAALASCRIPRTLHIRGRLTAEEDVVIEGRFTGEIDLPEHCLTIQAGAEVNATVFARDVTVRGTFAGRLTATDIVDIRDSADVGGLVKARRILLGENARVHARLETRRHMEAAAHVARYRREREPSPRADA